MSKETNNIEFYNNLIGIFGISSIIIFFLIICTILVLIWFPSGFFIKLLITEILLLAIALGCISVINKVLEEEEEKKEKNERYGTKLP